MALKEKNTTHDVSWYSLHNQLNEANPSRLGKSGCLPSGDVTKVYYCNNRFFFFAVNWFCVIFTSFFYVLLYLILIWSGFPRGAARVLYHAPGRVLRSCALNQSLSKTLQHVEHIVVGWRPQITKRASGEVLGTWFELGNTPENRVMSEPIMEGLN